MKSMFSLDEIQLSLITIHQTIVLTHQFHCRASQPYNIPLTMLYKNTRDLVMSYCNN